MVKRVFWIILDSFGIGHARDAAAYGDEGSNTLKSCFETGHLTIPHLTKLGLFNIKHNSYGGPAASPKGAFGRVEEMSAGKDTTNGHWEMCGLVMDEAMPIFPDGFPQEVVAEIERVTGFGVLLNKPYSGTQAIKDFGERHLETGKLILYTSADSVLQIAAHRDILKPSELYKVCEQIRGIMSGPWAVGRIIARPFDGQAPNFYRTGGRRDFSLEPPARTMLDDLKDQGFDVMAVGKINDIFCGHGITWTRTTDGDAQGMQYARGLVDYDFHGLAYVNLVDFDMIFGHRNDVEGYTTALNEFDAWLGMFLESLGPDDVFVMTADHGADPTTPSTDHSRENVPVIFAGEAIQPGVNVGVLPTFADIGATIADLLGATYSGVGESHAAKILKN